MFSASKELPVSYQPGSEQPSIYRSPGHNWSIYFFSDGEATRIGMIQTEVNTQRQAKAISEIDDLMTGMGALSIQFKHSDIIEEQEKRDSMEGRGCSSIMLDPVGEEPCDDLSIKRTEAIQESLEEQETKMQGTHLLRLEMQPKKKNHNRITRCLESARKMFESVQVLRRPIDKELNGAIHAIHEVSFEVIKDCCLFYCYSTS